MRKWRITINYNEDFQPYYDYESFDIVVKVPNGTSAKTIAETIIITNKLKQNEFCGPGDLLDYVCEINEWEWSLPESDAIVDLRKGKK